MAKKSKSMMPQSTAGLIRYFDDAETAIKLKPEHVIALAITIMAAVILLKFMVFI